MISCWVDEADKPTSQQGWWADGAGLANDVDEAGDAEVAKSNEADEAKANVANKADEAD